LIAKHTLKLLMNRPGHSMESKSENRTRMRL
jgi:hypothetical protein